MKAKKTDMTTHKKHHTMNKRLTPILIITSAFWLFGLSAKAQDRSTGPTIGGSVYGGGKGSSATVTGAVSVDFQAGTVGTIEAGNLKPETGDVYGGGKQAVVEGATTVELKGGTVRGDLYGGGALANVTSNAIVTLTGGSTRMVFGGGKGDANGSSAQVNGTTTVNVNNGSTVDGKVIATVGTTSVKGAVFGGCNENASVVMSMAVVWVILLRLAPRLQLLLKALRLLAMFMEDRHWVRLTMPLPISPKLNSRVDL